MNRHSVLLILLAVISASISWWLSDFNAPQQPAPVETKSSPDSYARDLTVVAFNEQGVPRYRLQAPQMRHYEQQDTTQLDDPILWQYTPDKPPWRVRGERAILTSSTDSLFMPGPVEIDRAGTDAIAPYHITTQDLIMNTLTYYAETDQSVRIDSDDHQVDGIGMQGWFQAPIRIRLLNQVRGYYETE